MTLHIETGPADLPIPQSAAIEPGMAVNLNDGTRAERLHRKIIAALQQHEWRDDLDAYWEAEEPILTALNRRWPEFYAAVEAAYDDHRAITQPKLAAQAANAHPAQPGMTATKATNMFTIDTGADGGGSKGPWISFKPKGSAKHGLPYKSWALRDKTDAGNSIAAFHGMESPGIVLDIYAKGGQLCGSLKLGWAKSDGESGKAPERRWWQSPLRSEPRPDESKTLGGGYTWRNALSVRAAIGGGKTATWEDEGWGVFKGFANLVNTLNAAFGANEGLCPMVRCIGYADSGSGANTTYVPQFEVVKWVPRPACLAEDAPQIAAAPINDAIPDFDRAKPAPAAAPAAAPARSAVPADAEF